MSTDLTAYFPEMQMSVWDKIGEIKKHLNAYNGVLNTEGVKKYRIEMARFHQKHPEFLAKLADLRKQYVLNIIFIGIFMYIGENRL